MYYSGGVDSLQTGTLDTRPDSVYIDNVPRKTPMQHIEEWMTLEQKLRIKYKDCGDTFGGIIIKSPSNINNNVFDSRDCLQHLDNTLRSSGN